MENKNLPYLFNVYTLSTLYVYNIIQGKQLKTSLKSPMASGFS